MNYSTRLIIGLLSLAAVACTSKSEEGPAPENDYYPVPVVGTYRTYAVTDSTWRDNVPAVQRFEFRERIAASFTDAAGELAYQVVRSRRATATDNWQDDSTLIVQPTAQTLLLTSNNRRTVELVYPARVGYQWNRNAYNALDTVVAKNRAYAQVGQPFSATQNGQTYAFDRTVTTADEDQRNAYYLIVQRQVYAWGTGLVYRFRRNFVYCDQSGSCVPRPTYIYRGFSRTEVLTATGAL